MKKQKQKQQGMWDLLIPIIIVILIHPLLVHLAVYSCGYAKYDWYAADDWIADFYCYYKSYFLVATAFFACAILAFRFCLYKEKTVSMKPYLPLLLYLALTLLSTLCSMNHKASVQGNFESFESCFVLAAYIIFSVYACQIMERERDYKIIWYAILGIGILFCVIGLMQAAGFDLMDTAFVQRLIMSEEEFALYGGTIEDTFSGGRVYLTLYNPNYAGIVLSMLFSIVFAMCVTAKPKTEKIAYGILSAVLLFLIWRTYARASLLAVILILFYMLFLQLKSGRILRLGRQLTVICLAAVLTAGSFLAFDYASGFPFLSRILEKNEREPLEYMTTDANGIHICYDGSKYLLFLEEDTLCCKESGGETIRAAKGDTLSLPMIEETAKAFFTEKENASIYLYLADNTLQFIKQDNGYFYRTPGGKITEMERVEAADFHGLEYLGSARGYIWSRVVPLLKNYLLIGSGPDTFAEVFPQQDYAGKLIYSDRPDMIIEKAHNDYLTKWVQTGMISVVCILIFYVLLIHMGRKAYQKKEAVSDMQGRLGYGCYFASIAYMVANLFNDSTIQTSPLFWIFAGITIRSMIDKNRKGS